MNLITNRYNQTTPTGLTADGVGISCPIYLNLTADQSKALLNAFRDVVARQRIEMGFNETPTNSTLGELSVETTVTPPQTTAENELGMSVEALRYALFSKGGVAERLILKLQELTNLTFVTSQQVAEVQSLWLSHIFSYEQNGIKTPSKKGKSNKSSKTVSTAAL